VRRLIWITVGTVFFLTCTVFAPVELTMYIIRYATQYGFFPEVCLIKEIDLVMELILIWLLRWR